MVGCNFWVINVDKDRTVSTGIGVSLVVIFKEILDHFEGNRKQKLAYLRALVNRAVDIMEEEGK